MNELRSSSDTRLQEVTQEILSHARGVDDDALFNSATVLGIDPASLNLSNIGDVFARAIEPVKQALSVTDPSASEQEAAQEATKTLDRLLEINGRRRVKTWSFDCLSKAAQVLEGFKQFENGDREIVIPVGMTIPQTGRFLNGVYHMRGGTKRVYCENHYDFWDENEADERLRTVPGRTYRLRYAETASSDLTAPLAPLGAVVIAEVCSRFYEARGFGNSLFRLSSLCVRGSHHQFAVQPDYTDGVNLIPFRGEREGSLLKRAILVDAQ